MDCTFLPFRLIVMGLNSFERLEIKPEVCLSQISSPQGQIQAKSQVFTKLKVKIKDFQGSERQVQLKSQVYIYWNLSMHWTLSAAKLQVAYTQYCA